MIKQKVYLLLEKLDQLNNRNVGSLSVLLLLTDIYSKELFFQNLISIAEIFLHSLSLVDKTTTRIQTFVPVIVNVGI